MQGKNILILGSGPSLKEHTRGIEQFIKNTKSIVISLNHNSLIPNELIDYQAACHPMRVIADIQKYKKMKQPLIIPYSSLPKLVKEKLDGCKVLDLDYPQTRIVLILELMLQTIHYHSSFHTY